MKKWGIDSRFLGNAAALLVSGMLLGAMGVNALADSAVDRTGILSIYFLQQYKYLEIDTTKLFWYIMGRRMKWVFLIWACGFTVAGLPCMALYTLWMGFSAGVLLGVSVLKLGLIGIPFTATALLPQALIYIPAWLYFFYGIYLKADGRIRIGAGKSLWHYILLVIGMCLAMVAGVLLESYLNPWFVKKILQLI